LGCDDIWDDIPMLKAFANRISPDDKEFKHLHPSQLAKNMYWYTKQLMTSSRSGLEIKCLAGCPCCLREVGWMLLD